MSISSFYADKEILVTGGTGFIGKVLIEKIIRSLPNVGKLYILTRSKKGKTSAERLKDILRDPLFRRAWEEQPQAFQKVVPIDGDCQELGLNLKPNDLEKIRNVSIIFHAAASVRFDDHLKPAILLNTRGTYELVKIAETLVNLKAFIHVSTTYAYPNKHTLDEKIYPAYADWRKTIKLAETFDTDTLNIFFPKYSLNQPNSYTFTKSLAEHIINDHRHKLPVAILRPSIVISTIEEPFPGWIDNFNGPIGMLVACGVGIMRTTHSNPDVVSDFIPVDFCVRTLLLSAYKIGIESKSLCGENELQVFNCSNSDMNSISTGQIIELGKRAIWKNPFEKGIWLPEGNITRCAVWHYIRLILLQLIPAICLDFFMKLARYPPFLLKLQRRIYGTSSCLYIFINTEWKFINKKLIELENLVPKEEEEGKCFEFLKYVHIDAEEFIMNGIKGAKEFLLKENPEASPQAKLRQRIFQILHYSIQFLGIFYIARFILRSLYSYFGSCISYIVENPIFP